MSGFALTASGFSRGLSNSLNRKQSPDQSLDKVTCAGFPIDQLDELLAKGPQLTATERQAMAADVRTLSSPC